MRNKGRIIALLAVVAVLFAAWFFLSRLPAPDAAQASPSPADAVNEVEIVPFSQSDISKIVMETPEGTLAMQKNEAIVESRTQNQDGSISSTMAAITLWEGKDLDVDTATADAVAFGGGNLKTLRRVVESATAEDLTNFGFSKIWKVTFSTADGKTATVSIGGTTPDGNGYYVMIPGNPAIYTAGTYSVQPMKVDRLALLNTNLYHRADTLQADITAIRSVRDGKLLFDAKIGEDTYWHLSEPVKVQGDISIFGTMQTALAGLKASTHLKADAANLTKFDLEKPKYEFTYAVAGKEHLLQIGGKDPANGFLYCRIDNADTVFMQDPTNFTFLDKPFVELIDKFLFIPTIYDVTRMTVIVDGRTDVLELDVPTPKQNPDNKLPEIYILNGVRLTGTDSISGLKRYYQGAIGVRADRVDFEVKPVYKSETSVLTVEYVMRNRVEKYMKVELIPTPDGYGYYGMRNGEYSGFIISRTQMDEDSMGIRAGYLEMLDKIALDKEKAAAATPSPKPSPTPTPVP